jgi:hypothetical protein
MLWLGPMILLARSLLLGAVVAVCLPGCGKSRPAESAKTDRRATAMPREETPRPKEVPSPPVAAMSSSAEPGVPFEAWLKDLRQAASRSSTAAPPAAAPTESGELFEIWVRELMQASPRTATAPAPSPEPAASPAPTASAAPVSQPVAAPMATPPPARENGEAARRAASDDAARKRFQMLALVYGAGQGFTGVGAGAWGYTGAGAGDGYTGAGAGDGYTGVTGSSTTYASMSAAPPPGVELMWTPYGSVPIAVQP